MLAFSALVAGSFALGVLAAPLVHPLALNAARFVLAAAVIGAAVFATGRLRRAHLAAPWRYGILGGLFALYFAMMFWGLQTADAVSMAAVFTLTPVMSAGFGWLLLRQRTTPRMGLALALAAAGALWVIFDADPAALAAFDIGRGEAIFFLGCIAHALYTPRVPTLARGEPILVLTFGTLVAGALALAVVGSPAMLATDWGALPAIVWITILYLAVFASSVTFFLVQYAAVRLPSAKVMAYTYLTPAWVILWQVALGGALPKLALLPGIALVVTGLLLLLRD